jgi:hypothetical protein
VLTHGGRFLEVVPHERQSTGEREGHRGGWTSAFERLDELLASMARARS